MHLFYFDNYKLTAVDVMNNVQAGKLIFILILKCTNVFCAKYMLWTQFKIITITVFPTAILATRVIYF